MGCTHCEVQLHALSPTKLRQSSVGARSFDAEKLATNPLLRLERRERVAQHVRAVRDVQQEAECGRDGDRRQPEQHAHAPLLERRAAPRVEREERGGYRDERTDGARQRQQQPRDGAPACEPRRAHSSQQPHSGR